MQIDILFTEPVTASEQFSEIDHYKWSLQKTNYEVEHMSRA